MELRLRKNNIIDILKINEKISQVRDLYSLLDLVLLEARTITGADAGSIYLVRKNKLSFEYVQNDSLMGKGMKGQKYLYQKQEIEIDNTSVAGFVALNKKQLNIRDAYKIKGDVPYSFNRSFDEAASYRTSSILTSPMVTIENQLVGVMQMINAKNGRGKVVSFSRDDAIVLSLLANQAASAIEKAKMTREIILRMIRIAELKDPEETGTHVNRVGAYAIEIYRQWARKQDIKEEKIKRMQDVLRMTAMLHDAGKVAISDAILKKQGSLDSLEFEHMKMHTVFGARLFKDSNTDWDKMAAEIALNHHEKWDGSGYPGHIEDVNAHNIKIGEGKQGEEIPISARIVALADVYDALTSSRSYKDSWPEAKVLDYIEQEKGKHFDPVVVESFMEIYEVIQAIREKYKN